MLWSLLKVLLFVAITAGLAVGASQLTDMGGALQITVAGWEFTLGPLQTAIAAVLVLAMLWIVLKLVGFLIAIFRFLNGDETAISRYFDRDRERRGYDTLGQGLIALSSGEARLALVKAQRAEKLLENGFLDMIVPRTEMKGTVARLLRLLAGTPPVQASAPPAEAGPVPAA